MKARKTMTKTTNNTIVVITSGWVFVGNYHKSTGDAPAYLTNASNVRKWGTTAGLGELALNGPTKDTVLDPCGIVMLENPQAVLFIHPCNW
jgi:hypothetical protein